MDIMPQSACLVVNPITVYSYDFRKHVGVLKKLIKKCYYCRFSSMEGSFTYKVVVVI